MDEVNSPAKSGVRVDAYTKATRRHICSSDMILGDMSWTQGPYTTHPHTRIITHLVSLIKNPQILPISLPRLAKNIQRGTIRQIQSMG